MMTQELAFLGRQQAGHDHSGWGIAVDRTTFSTKGTEEGRQTETSSHNLIMGIVYTQYPGAGNHQF